MHQNYVMKKGVNAKQLKEKILASFDAGCVECPAENKVAHEYTAKPALKTFY
jgi:D-lactate dehydrogenase